MLLSTCQCDYKSKLKGSQLQSIVREESGYLIPKQWRRRWCDQVFFGPLYEEAGVAPPFPVETSLPPVIMTMFVSPFHYPFLSYTTHSLTHIHPYIYLMYTLRVDMRSYTAFR
ncbi:uncharacterized protein G2W53_019744 [Senna tora]|uniref:Uncharacterized protein n=1 Tax=Senna tora TaxID=362788 RepID=A0A834TYR1_9FABA|nr:uncharacterized protein G2W53_019744 [Senna tora]